MDNTLESWEQEITNQPGFFEQANIQMNFLAEAIELDFQLEEAGIFVEDAKAIGETIKNKVIAFIARCIVILAKLIGRIAEFIKKFINNVKFKTLEKKAKAAAKDFDEEKLNKILSKRTFIDPNKLIDNCQSMGLFNTDVTIAPFVDDEKTQSRIAQAIPGLASITSNTKKGQLKNIDDLVTLGKDTDDVIRNFNGHLKNYTDSLKTLKNNVKTKKFSNNEDIDKEDIKWMKKRIPVIKSAISSIQRIVEMLMKQQISIYKVYMMFDKNDVDEFDDEDFEWEYFDDEDEWVDDGEEEE